MYFVKFWANFRCWKWPLTKTQTGVWAIAKSQSVCPKINLILLDAISTFHYNLSTQRTPQWLLENVEEHRFRFIRYVSGSDHF